MCVVSVGPFFTFCGHSFLIQLTMPKTESLYPQVSVGPTQAFVRRFDQKP